VGGVDSVVRTVCVSLDDLMLVSQAVSLRSSAKRDSLAGVSKAKLWGFNDRAMHFSRYTTQYRI
jgi:hypothetical protein